MEESFFSCSHILRQDKENDESKNPILVELGKNPKQS